MTNEIQTTTELLHAPFREIEYAELRLKHEDRGHYVRGRIIGRYGNNDLTLLFRGQENKVVNAADWTILRYQPVTSTIEKQMVADQLGAAQ